MKKRLLLCCFGLCASVFAQEASAQQQSLAELEKRAFQQLESGKTDPTATAETILTQAGNRPSIYVINANTILGIVHKNKGHYVSALEYYLDATEKVIKLVKTELVQLDPSKHNRSLILASDLSAGIYVIEVANTEMSIVSKIIK